MSDDRWDRLDSLFQRAADLAPAERVALLAEVRADDPELADELEALLRFDRVGERPLDQAVQGAVTSILDRAGPDRRGTRLGPYRIIEELGHGGMGTVYLAERADDAYHAQVAIKLIRGGVASREQIRRFKSERQILASLNHPNIGRLLDGGTTPDGLPYVVMEAIDGEPIDDYCDRLKLSVRDRIHLFRAVSDAVAYAHRNLVVHRDIKPGNILVTADGVPKLLDFGIAKLVEPGASGETRTAVAMTPAYASPEQVRGEAVTTATDVYALGTVLYELLTGRPAHRFETGTPGEIERVICQLGPERPSTAVSREWTMTNGSPAVTPGEVGGARSTDPSRLRHQLSGDLDTIVMMALRKEPERRYRSVEAFSADLANYLLVLPVSARAESVRYRASKFVARHRAAVIGASTAALVMVALVAFYTLRLADERDRARIEATKAETMAGFLAGLFEIDERTPAAGAAVTARELLDRGVETISDLDDPEVKGDLLFSMATAYGNLGLFDQATPLYRESESLSREVLGPDAAETSAVRAALANNLWERGDYAAADSVFQVATPGFAGHPEQLAAALANRGRALMRLGRLDEARAAYEESLRLQDDLPGDRRPSTAAILSTLGQIALDADDREGAEAYAREAVTIDRELEAEGQGTLSTSLQSLGAILVSQRRLDEAEELLLESLALEEERLGPLHPDLTATVGELSRILMLRGDPAAALPFLRRAVDIGRARGEDHADLAYDLTTLAQGLTQAGAFDEAAETAEEAVRMSRATDGPDSPFLARAILTWGVVLGDQGRLDDALSRLDEAVGIAEAALPDGHSFTANLLMNRAGIRVDAGDLAGAEADYLASYEVHRDTFGADEARSVSIARRLADLYEDWGRPGDAATWRDVAGG